MDATRSRRTRDRARQRWYAGQRQRRFARFLAGLANAPAPSPRLDRQPGPSGLGRLD